MAGHQQQLKQVQSSEIYEFCSEFSPPAYAAATWWPSTDPV